MNFEEDVLAKGTEQESQINYWPKMGIF